MTTKRGSTKLRLLLDECIQAPLAAQIIHSSGVSSVVWVSPSDLAAYANKGMQDSALLEYATRENRILVTVEGRLNEKKFTICTHAGIIVIKATIHHEVVKAELFRRFMRSGHRVKSKHAVTKLRLEGSSRIERTPDGRLREVSIKLPKS